MQFCDILAVYFENHTEFLNCVWTACRVSPFKADGAVIHCALKFWRGMEWMASQLRDTHDVLYRWVALSETQEISYRGLTTTVCLATPPCCLCIYSIPQITGNLTATWHNKTFESGEPSPRDTEPSHTAMVIWQINVHSEIPKFVHRVCVLSTIPTKEWLCT